MPAYIIAQITVTDPAKYARYTELTPGAIAKYSGRFIARGGKTAVLEGRPDSRRVVVIEFPTFSQAEAFYFSKEYQEAKTLRENAATASFLLVDGWDG